MISVIIPSYNRAATIKRSVQSVLSQTWRDLECIVVDDGSTDDTEKKLSDISDERLRYYRLERNSGACVARNKGIKLAKGDYIAYQDSDDVWHTDKLEIQMNALNKSGADVCYCRKCRISITEEKSDETEISMSEGIVPYEILYKSARVSTQTLLAHKYVFDRFHFDENVKKAQDYEWSIRAGEYFSFYFVAQALVDQYFQEDSITVKGEKNYLIGEKCAEYFYQKFYDKYDLHPGLEVVLLKWLANYKILCGMRAVDEYKKIYKITFGRKEYLLYLASKFCPFLLKLQRLYKRRNSIKLTK